MMELTLLGLIKLFVLFTFPVIAFLLIIIGSITSYNTSNKAINIKIYNIAIILVLASTLWGLFDDIRGITDCPPHAYCASQSLIDRFFVWPAWTFAFNVILLIISFILKNKTQKKLEESQKQKAPEINPDLLPRI